MRISKVCSLLTRAPRYALVGSNCQESTCRGWIPSMPLPFFIQCLALSSQASCDQLFFFQHKHIVTFIDHEYILSTYIGYRSPSVHQRRKSV